MEDNRLEKSPEKDNPPSREPRMFSRYYAELIAKVTKPSEDSGGDKS